MSRPNYKNKNKQRDFRDNRRDRRDWEEIGIAETIDDVEGKHDWVRIQMTIPRQEQHRRLEFKQSMLSTFTERISEFVDKDAHLEGNNVIFFIPFGNSELVTRRMKDIVEDLRPKDVSVHKFIKLNPFPSNPPISARFEQISNAEQILTEELGKKYDQNTNSLDLSNWNSNANLMQNGMKMALGKGEHMALLVRILAGFPIENMTGLNLSNNHLRNLQQLEPLIPKLPKLKELILKGNNMIRSWDDLKWVAEWKIEKLDISDCLLSKTVNGKNSIKQSREARKIFKHLKSFNGKELCVTFDLDNTETSSDVATFPKRLDSSLPSAEGLEGPLIAFVQKFFAAFDGDRESLYHCYKSDAVFTMSTGRGQDLQSYRKNNRNLVNFKAYNDPNMEKYRSCHPNSIKKRKIQIMACFEDIPKTQHDLLNSCLMDVTLQVASIIGFTLTGTFKESESGKVRFFSRHMLCTFDAASKAFMICHDQLFVRASTDLERDNHGTKQAFEKQPSAVAGQSEDQKKTAVTKFMHDSGMVESYSQMCLEQNDWNYNKAAEKFIAMKSAGQIPDDAWQPGRKP